MNPAVAAHCAATGDSLRACPRAGSYGNDKTKGNAGAKPENDCSSHDF
jgi:hypothetical protein